jgi:hypothetical protein
LPLGFTGHLDTVPLGAQPWPPRSLTAGSMAAARPI